MAFVKKEWLQRIVDFPGRRKLSPTEIPNTYDVTRDEGTVIQAGDSLSAVNMNDLEGRIEAGLDEKIDKAVIVQNALSTNPDTVASGPVAKDLQDQINGLNNNITKTSGTLSLASNVTSAYSIIKKSSNRVFINISLTVSTSGSDINLGTLSTGFRPTVNPVFGTCGVYRSGSCVAVQGIYIGTNGTLQIKTTTAFTSGDSVRASIAFDID